MSGQGPVSEYKNLFDLNKSEEELHEELLKRTQTLTPQKESTKTKEDENEKNNLNNSSDVQDQIRHGRNKSKL